MDPMQHYFPRKLPKVIQQITELAMDLRWASSHSSDRLWEKIDPDLWQTTGNPTLILETISQQKLETLANDPDFLHLLSESIRLRDEHLQRERWYEKLEHVKRLNVVAYFSMEFGLSEALPIYSGGLGILAGDVLKTASDLGIPLIGIGLLYQQGYFRQVFGRNGEQLAYFPYNDPAMMPVLPLRDTSGEWIRVNVPFPGRCIIARCWEAQVGQSRLLLLDTNDPTNAPADRGITSELYGGDNERRLQQEILLGIGGWRLLENLGLKPQICHLNEGHAALATLERAAHCMREYRIDFSTALICTRAGNLFTTHTPVPAAMDHFEIEMVSHYLQPYADQWHVDLDFLISLGLDHADPEARHYFNPANLALRASGACNGVSKLHGQVSRSLFSHLFPRWPVEEVPIGSVTNGVHTLRWDSRHASEIWKQSGGASPWYGDLHNITDAISQLPDTELWSFRGRQRSDLIQAVRDKMIRQYTFQGRDQTAINRCTRLLDPNALTLGFARRFTEYKRTNLLLQYPERLKTLLSNPNRPVQLFLAGKAHPKDSVGQAMVQEWNTFIRDSGIPEGRVVFLDDYDIQIASILVQGVDVWINTPRRPWEASGTSGMKVLINGGLNISELDGWWAEAYTPDVGWAIGDGKTHDDIAAWDTKEAEDLYTVLEQEVVPLFYERDPKGLPKKWLDKVRTSMIRLTPQYSTNRMLREYTLQYYLPQSENYLKRTHDGAQLAKELRAWHQEIENHWHAVYLGNHFIAPNTNGFTVDAQVFLDDLSPEKARVEMYADPLEQGASPEVYPLRQCEQLSGTVHGYRYQTVITTNRPIEHFTLRIRPYHPEALLPLENPLIIWAT